jgi:DNA primase
MQFSQPPRLITPPPAPWQAKAREFCEGCEERLWSPAGLKAREYLYRRGLQDDTILAARVGYHHVLRWERRETWGLPSDPEGKPLWLPPGIVFPWTIGGDLWKVTIRRFGDDVPHNRRHIEVSGSANAVYRVDTVQANRPVGIVEAPLDALSLAQEAGDLLAVVAAGTSWGRLERWIRQLALSSKVLLMFDADEGGEKATAWWLKALGLRAKRWRPYWDDPNALLQDRVDLRTWVREGLGTDPKWWRELARWPEDRQEWWAERAAIMEVAGGLIRDEAEREAFERLRDDPSHPEYAGLASDCSDV